MVVPLMSSKASDFDMPGMSSLRMSLLMPCVVSHLAISPKSESGRDLERELGAARPLAFHELQRKLADLAGQQRAILLARRDHEAGDLGVVLDLRFEIGRLEGRVRNPPDTDHRFCLSRRSSSTWRAITISITSLAPSVMR